MRTHKLKAPAMECPGARSGTYPVDRGYFNATQYATTVFSVLSRPLFSDRQRCFCSQLLIPMEQSLYTCLNHLSLEPEMVISLMQDPDTAIDFFVFLCHSLSFYFPDPYLTFMKVQKGYRNPNPRETTH